MLMVGNPNPVGYSSSNAPNYHTVQEGDCLWNIAMAGVQREAPLQGDDLTNATANELQLIEQANPQIVQQGGSGTYDLIWAGDKIDIPNAPQTPGVAPQTGAIPTVAVNGGQPGLVIPTGTVLHAGDSYTSPNGQYTLTMQKDGNLVLYKNNPDGKRTPVFATGTYKGNPYHLDVGDHAVLQPDGNLVIYKANSDGDKPSDAVWSSNTSSTGVAGGDVDAGGTPGIPSDANAVLAVQDDGNIVIYTSGGFAAWDAAHQHDSKGRLGGDKGNGDPTSGSTV
jgi:hypothetical protein